MNTSSRYGIAIFHGIGDILNCTPIAKQLKLTSWIAILRGTPLQSTALLWKTTRLLTRL